MRSSASYALPAGRRSSSSSSHGAPPPPADQSAVSSLATSPSSDHYDLIPPGDIEWRDAVPAAAAPPPPLPQVAAAAAMAASAADINSSGHSAPAPSTITAAPQLKALFRYGGRIVPDPQTNQLRYKGGESRIVTIARSTPFADFKKKLCSIAFPDGHHGPASVKYQLPYEDLDALISLTGDEDLENMIEEFDKTQIAPQQYHQMARTPSTGLIHSSLQPQPSSSGPPSQASRIRLFLFSAATANGESKSQPDSVANGSVRGEHEMKPSLMQLRDAAAPLDQGSNPAALASESPAKLALLTVTTMRPASSASAPASASVSGNNGKEAAEDAGDRGDGADPRVLVVDDPARSHATTIQDRVLPQKMRARNQEVLPSSSPLRRKNDSPRARSSSSHGENKKQDQESILPEATREEIQTLQKIPGKGMRPAGTILKFSGQQTMDHSTGIDGNAVATGDPSFDEEAPSLHISGGHAGTLDRHQLKDRSSAVSSSQPFPNIAPPPVQTGKVSDPFHHSQVPLQKKDLLPSHGEDRKISDSEGHRLLAAGNDAVLPSRSTVVGIQDRAAKEPSWPTREPAESCGHQEGLSIYNAAGVGPVDPDSSTSVPQGFRNQACAMPVDRLQPAMEEDSESLVTSVQNGKKMFTRPSAGMVRSRSEMNLHSNVKTDPMDLHAAAVLVQDRIAAARPARKLIAMNITSDPLTATLESRIGIAGYGGSATMSRFAAQPAPAVEKKMKTTMAASNLEPIKKNAIASGPPVYEYTGNPSQHLAAAAAQDQSVSAPPFKQDGSLYHLQHRATRPELDHPVQSASVQINPPYPKGNSTFLDDSAQHVQQPLAARISTNPFTDDYSPPAAQYTYINHELDAVESVHHHNTVGLFHGPGGAALLPSNSATDPLSGSSQTHLNIPSSPNSF